MGDMVEGVVIGDVVAHLPTVGRRWQGPPSVAVERIEVSVPISRGRIVSVSSISVSGRMPNSVVSEACGFRVAS